MSKELRSRLSPRDLVGEAVAAIARRPGRSLLTALGTVVGVGAFVATTGLATTARSQVSDSFDALRATEVLVVPTATGSALNPFPTDVNERLQRLNGVRTAGTFWPIADETLDARSFATPSPGGPSSLAVVAADPGAIVASRPTLADGVLIDAIHNDRAERVAILGRHAAEQLGIERVDQQPTVYLGNTGFTVIGILADVERNEVLHSAVIVPAGTARQELPTAPTEFSVLIDVDAGAADLIGHQALLALRPDDPTALQSLVPPDPRSLREQVESDVGTLLYGLAGLALLVGMIGIANTTLVAVLERRAEIGVRRALGARRWHVAAQFLTESAAIGTVGGLIGACIGVVAVVAVAASRGWTTTVDPWLTIPAPAFGLVAGLLAGLQPAWRASRITPATALRSD